MQNHIKRITRRQQYKRWLKTSSRTGDRSYFWVLFETSITYSLYGIDRLYTLVKKKNSCNTDLLAKKKRKKWMINVSASRLSQFFSATASGLSPPLVSLFLFYFFLTKFLQITNN